MSHRILQSAITGRSQGRRGWNRAAALSALVLALAAAPAQGPAKAAPADSSTRFAERLLEVHNHERVRVGQRPFTWSSKLAENAAHWAQSQAARGTFDHAPPRLRTGQGEIVWNGETGVLGLEAIIGRFIGERQNFRPGVFPNVSRSGDWSDVGHYTQIIWPATREVGCAMTSLRGQDFLVCRYAPEGNMTGQRVP